MAKQTGETKLQGRVGDIIYYKMNGKYFARAVSSLSRKRVKKSKAFASTRFYAALNGIASKAASRVFQCFPKEWKKKKKCFYKMSGHGYKMLMRGSSIQDITESLIMKFAPVAMKNDLLQDLVRTGKILQEKLNELFAKSPVHQFCYDIKREDISVSNMQSNAESITAKDLAGPDKFVGEKLKKQGKYPVEEISAVHQLKKQRLKIKPAEQFQQPVKKTPVAHQQQKNIKPTKPAGLLKKQGKKIKMVKTKTRKAV